MLHSLRLTTILLLLAGLDLGAAICLKEASLRRDPGLAMIGLGTFVLLGGVVYYALEAAELTVVQLGWSVALQVLVLAVDAYRYHLVPGRVQAIALVVAVVAMIVVAIAPARQLEPTGHAIPLQRGPTLEDRVIQQIQDRRREEFRALPARRRLLDE